MSQKNIEFDFDRCLDAGDAVVALGRLSVGGGSGGVNGRITYARSYLQPKDALEAVGLRE